METTTGQITMTDLANTFSTTTKPTLPSTTTMLIEVVECIDRCNLVLAQVQTKSEHRFKLAQYQSHYLTLLLKSCHAKLENVEAKTINFEKLAQVLDDWSVFQQFAYDQRYGLAIGSVATLISCFLDQRLASRYSKQNQIKLRALMKFIFPTLLAFVCVLLRKRNKDSKLANFLSAIKKRAPVPPDHNDNFSFQSCNQSKSKPPPPPPFPVKPRNLSDSVRYRVEPNPRPQTFIAMADIEQIQVCDDQRSTHPSMVTVNMSQDEAIEYQNYMKNKH